MYYENECGHGIDFADFQETDNCPNCSDQCAIWYWPRQYVACRHCQTYWEAEDGSRGKLTLIEEIDESYEATN